MLGVNVWMVPWNSQWDQRSRKGFCLWVRDSWDKTGVRKRSCPRVELGLGAWIPLGIVSPGLAGHPGAVYQEFSRGTEGRIQRESPAGAFAGEESPQQSSGLKQSHKSNVSSSCALPIPCPKPCVILAVTAEGTAQHPWRVSKELDSGGTRAGKTIFRKSAPKTVLFCGARICFVALNNIPAQQDWGQCPDHSGMSSMAFLACWQQENFPKNAGGELPTQATAITGFGWRCRSPTTTSSTPSWAAGTKTSSRKSNPIQQGGKKIPLRKGGRSSCPKELPFHPSTGTCWGCSFQGLEDLKDTIISQRGKPRLSPTTTSATELYPVLPAASRICFSITQNRPSWAPWLEVNITWKHEEEWFRDFSRELQWFCS